MCVRVLPLNTLILLIDPADPKQSSTPDGDQEEDLTWMQSIDVRFDLLTDNGLPATGVLQIRL